MGWKGTEIKMWNATSSHRGVEDGCGLIGLGKGIWPDSEGSECRCILLGPLGMIFRERGSVCVSVCCPLIMDTTSCFALVRSTVDRQIRLGSRTVSGCRVGRALKRVPANHRLRYCMSW